MKQLILLLCLFQATVLSAAEQQHWLAKFQDQDELFSIDGYRLLRYRSPTPDQAEGAQTIGTAELKQMLGQASPPALVNVQPIRWQHGHFLQNEPFLHIPGSRWIPNVGMGELDSGWEDYFRHHLKLATKNQQSARVVLYCRADCWMSWNAVKRAASWGYNQLFWYKDGVDGWRDAGYELRAGTPEPYPVRAHERIYN